MPPSSSHEQIISARPGRVIVRPKDGSAPVVLRRIDPVLILNPSGQVSDDTSVPARWAALKKIEGRRLAAIAPIHSVTRSGETIEVAEQWVDGFSLAASVARRSITVDVALSFIADVTEGLVQLHAALGDDGRGALVHGRVSLDRMLVDASGEVYLVGFEGLQGDPSVDAAGVMDALRGLLDRHGASTEGRKLVERMRALTFSTTQAVRSALRPYLERQDPERLRGRRRAFNVAMRRELGLPPPTGSTQNYGFGAPLPTPNDVPSEVPSPLPSSVPSPVPSPVWEAPEQAVPLETPGPVDDDSPTHLERFAGEEVTIDGAAAMPSDLTPTEAVRARVVDDLSLEDVLNEEPPASPPPARPPASRSASVRRAVAAPRRRSSPPPPSSGHGVEFGDYRVLASIGRGGMGEIYLARKRSGKKAGARVALKILGSSAHNPDFDDAVTMLMDEAAIMARIEHPHVVKVIDFGRALDRYFLATEYLEGRPLVRVMIEAYRQDEGLGYGVIATIGADAALGLYAAHTASTAAGAPLKVIHRDVSPQNIFVTFEGVTKVIDFGVARASERISQTAIGMVKGKAAYMSPEQATAAEIDGRSDVFGLGVCLWEMTAGRRLFKRPEEYETLLAVQSADIPPPTRVRGRPNPVLDHIILSALHRDPHQRTPSAQALAAQLMELAEHAGGPDRRRRVRELLHRLFGEVAAKEKVLIRTLESTDDPSTSGDLHEVTMLGRSTTLKELDDFGRDRASPAARRPGPTTSEHVIARVADARSALGLRTPSKPPPSARPEPPKKKVVLPPFQAPKDSRDLPAAPAVAARAASDSGRFEPLPVGSAPPRPASPAPAPRRAPVLPWPAVLTLGIVLLAGGVWAGLKFRGSTAADPVGSLKRPVGAPPPASVEPVHIFASDDDPMVRPEVRAPSAARTEMAAFVRAARKDGLAVTQTRGTFVIDDGHGGTVTLDAGAGAYAVDAPGAKGWVVAAASPALPAVAWVGRVKGQAPAARSLSVNDCRASLRLEASGVSIRYGRDEVHLPHGGGLLMDVSLSRPEFADRVEVDPLGLSFGKADPAQPQLHCNTGWWGTRVVLRRLPPGRYTLRWIGEAMRQTGTMELDPDGATGAELIRAVGAPE